MSRWLCIVGVLLYFVEGFAEEESIDNILYGPAFKEDLDEISGPWYQIATFLENVDDNSICNHFYFRSNYMVYFNEVCEDIYNQSLTRSEDNKFSLNGKGGIVEFKVSNDWAIVAIHKTEGLSAGAIAIYGRSSDTIDIFNELAKSSNGHILKKCSPNMKYDCHLPIDTIQKLKRDNLVNDSLTRGKRQVNSKTSYKSKINNDKVFEYGDYMDGTVSIRKINETEFIVYDDIYIPIETKNDKSEENFKIKETPIKSGHYQTYKTDKNLHDNTTNNIKELGDDPNNLSEPHKDNTDGTIINEMNLIKNSTLDYAQSVKNLEDTIDDLLPDITLNVNVTVLNNTKEVESPILIVSNNSVASVLDKNQNRQNHSNTPLIATSSIAPVSDINSVSNSTNNTAFKVSDSTNDTIYHVSDSQSNDKRIEESDSLNNDTRIIVLNISNNDTMNVSSTNYTTSNTSNSNSSDSPDNVPRINLSNNVTIDSSNTSSNDTATNTDNSSNNDITVNVYNSSRNSTTIDVQYLPANGTKINSSNHDPIVNFANLVDNNNNNSTISLSTDNTSANSTNQVDEISLFDNSMKTNLNGSGIAALSTINCTMCTTNTSNLLDNVTELNSYNYSTSSYNYSSFKNDQTNSTYSMKGSISVFTIPMNGTNESIDVPTESTISNTNSSAPISTTVNTMINNKQFHVNESFDFPQSSLSIENASVTITYPANSSSLAIIGNSTFIMLQNQSHEVSTLTTLSNVENTTTVLARSTLNESEHIANNMVSMQTNVSITGSDIFENTMFTIMKNTTDNSIFTILENSTITPQNVSIYIPLINSTFNSTLTPIAPHNSTDLIFNTTDKPNIISVIYNTTVPFLNTTVNTSLPNAATKSTVGIWLIIKNITSSTRKPVTNATKQGNSADRSVSSYIIFICVCLSILKFTIR